MIQTYGINPQRGTLLCGLIPLLFRKVEQETVNQRLKFLIDKLSMSARAFSEHIGESPTTTHNYTSQRNAEPRAGYLSKVVSHFKDIDARWLLTGEGLPFMKSPAQPVSTYQNQEKNKGNVVGTNHGTISQQQAGKDDYKKELAAARHTIALLTSQLQDKERIIQLYERQTSSSK